MLSAKRKNIWPSNSNCLLENWPPRFALRYSNSRPFASGSGLWIFFGPTNLPHKRTASRHLISLDQRFSFFSVEALVASPPQICHSTLPARCESSIADIFNSNTVTSSWELGGLAEANAEGHAEKNQHRPFCVHIFTNWFHQLPNFPGHFLESSFRLVKKRKTNLTKNQVRELLRCLRSVEIILIHLKFTAPQKKQPNQWSRINPKKLSPSNRCCGHPLTASLPQPTEGHPRSPRWWCFWKARWGGTLWAESDGRGDVLSHDETVRQISSCIFLAPEIGD